MTNQMSPTAIKADQESGSQLIPINTIYLDHNWNCRGYFTPVDCTELARDVARRGLLQPVIIRKLRTEALYGLPSEAEIVKKGFLYTMVAGHRRLTAYKINEAEVIPVAKILPENTPDFDCRDINACENLQRKELNLAQECAAIKHYWMAGWSREEICDRVQKSVGWVQPRIMLLEMPDAVMEMAAKEFIKPSDIRELHKYKGNTDELLRAAAKIRDHRRSGQQRGVTHLIKRKDTYNTKKCRKRQEMFDMLSEIQTAFYGKTNDNTITVRDILTPQGNFIATRLLAWCAGEISTGEFHDDLKTFAKKLGFEYVNPTYADVEKDILRI